ncbi:hypothetical protein AJ78_07712 [Emergomyces pasteurianus Ep9510]|uniref:Subtelomeric hrmA-associated cluster protein AFUB-079030/YDR124W-like helical bundle domain-containing protein n=1 Tax=Emergomyces pasteurianus Ep9510 TaxID=1447872 RepID=A0A1J9PUI4_9EURO|nr:hypothetical protein AJ78_07712 [Emergomyces pasteurianus Ep9510]
MWPERHNGSPIENPAHFLFENVDDELKGKIDEHLEGFNHIVGSDKFKEITIIHVETIDRYLSHYDIDVLELDRYRGPDENQSKWWPNKFRDARPKDLYKPELSIINTYIFLQVLRTHGIPVAELRDQTKKIVQSMDDEDMAIIEDAYERRSQAEAFEKEMKKKAAALDDLERMALDQQPGRSH